MAIGDPGSRATEWFLRRQYHYSNGAVQATAAKDRINQKPRSISEMNPNQLNINPSTDISSVCRFSGTSFLPREWPLQ
jgi:hypothetical protein